MKRIVLTILILSSAFEYAYAQRPPKNYRPPKVESVGTGSTISYDISAGSGRYNDLNYSEINAGLNWQFSEWMVWRNALFHRFGTGFTAVTGLDTSVRFGNSFSTEDRTLGLDFFLGPGYRFASEKDSAVFGEAGIGFKLAGLYLGVGMKSLYYTNPGKDANGNDLSKNDNQVFIVLSGGGTL